MLYRFHFSIVFILFQFGSGAQPSTTENNSLYQQIYAQDSIFFAAFNVCDTNTSKALFSRDLEFFHDKGGFTNYEQNLASIRKRCSMDFKVRRELVQGSMEVYPVKDFGAIQSGQHKFYITRNGEETLDGTFKFVHIWRQENKIWKIFRVISYDH